MIDLKNVEPYLREFSLTAARNSNGNFVCAPLAAWALLSTVYVAAEFNKVDPLRERFEGLLGGSQSEIAELLGEILQELSDSYSAVTSFGAGLRDDARAMLMLNRMVNDRFADVLTSLPTKKWLDDWVDESTDGFIKKFPAEVDEGVLFFIANVLYTKFEWLDALKIVTAPAAAAAAWGQREMLCDKNGELKFYRHGVDLYALLTLDDTEPGKELHTVIPVSPERLLRADMMAVTLDIVNGSAKEIEHWGALTGFSPNLMIYGNKEVSNTHEVTLPAWEADTQIDLMVEDAYGFSHAPQLVSNRSEESSALQVSKAKFTSKGFEAAAVTALLMRAAGAAIGSGNYHAELTSVSGQLGWVAMIHGVPLFMGVVEEASPAE